MNQIMKIEKILTTLDRSTFCSLQSLNSEKTSSSLKLVKEIFLSFYETGISDQAAAALKSPQNQETKNSKSKIVELVTKHSEWMQHFIPAYARTAIDFQGETSDEKVYEVRSGLEFMFSLLKNYSKNFDSVLDDIKVGGSIEDEFDQNLKLWLESGAYVPLKAIDVHKNVKNDHWWWSKAV